MQVTLNSASAEHAIKEENTLVDPKIYTIIPVFLWLLFLANLSAIIYFLPDAIVWEWKNIFKINGFTLLIWTTVTFFSAIVSSYSSSYLRGFTYRSSFTILSLGFLFSVMLLVISNHFIPFIAAWLLMGIFMARLIGVNRAWPEAKEAAKYAQKYFLAGTLFLALGLFLITYQSGSWSISETIANLDQIPKYTVLISSICIIMAALIQSASYPFQRWLLSAMTAPTPASALMHAGFVNGAGILLSLFSAMFFRSETLTILFIVGGITAVIAQFTKLLQVNVKQKLACSTIAQMGFMIMQCGLGFFNAAIAHLILHGFYKAYLFLSTGEEIKHSDPKLPEKIVITPIQAVVVIVFGLLGAALFSYLTGKGTALNSGILLTMIVAITVGQVTYNIVKQNIFTNTQKLIYPILIFTVGILMYSGIYNAVTFLVRDMPKIDEAIPISATHIIFGIIFLMGFFIMKLGVYKKIPWLYVKLLNDSQAHGRSIISNKK